MSTKKKDLVEFTVLIKAGPDRWHSFGIIPQEVTR